MKWLKKVATTPLDNIAKVVDSIMEQTNDRTNAPSIHAVREAIKDNSLTIYPIGSIYMSVNNVDPSTIFGGTWEQIKDRFLLASGDTYNNGDTGGAATHTPSGTVGNHTLTIDEMPAHTHKLSSSPSFQSAILGESQYFAGTEEVEFNTSSVGGNQPHNHTFTGTNADTMPPYLAVNVWVRRA